MQIGIIGLPNVGKSTLFNALLKKQVALAANYPFATIEPNIGIVDVPDARLDKLTELVKPAKTVPAVVKFVDIAGLVKGASEGEGLGNKFLSHVREVDALVHVIRKFEDDDIARAGSTDPESDREVIETELMLADLQSVEKMIEKDQRIARSGDKEGLERIKLLDKLYQALSNGEMTSSVILTEKEEVLVKSFNLLTIKPMIQVYNVFEDAFIKGSFGIHASGLDKVIKRGFDILGLHTYFTAGEKEVRAWTIEKGDKAPQAAGKIHTDFERGFISAEVISFNDYVACGTRLVFRFSV